LKKRYGPYAKFGFAVDKYVLNSDADVLKAISTKPLKLPFDLTVISKEDEIGTSADLK
jgi:hypothetical protein